MSGDRTGVPVISREGWRTLCIVRRDRAVLLGLKKRGFGAGKWNGFGGKLQVGETLEEAARRELWEEAGIQAVRLMERGRLAFTFQDGTAPLQVHVFLVTDFAGQPHETEEMRPQWFPVDEIPYEMMWADDRYWLPLLLAGQQFTGTFAFADQAQLVNHSVKAVA